MTFETFWLQNGGTIIAAVIMAIPGILAAYWSKRGVAVSRGNANALSVVRDRQDQNKTAITTEIKSVTHELRNGFGDMIAAKAAVHMAPAFEEMKKTIPVEVAKEAKVVAAALVETKLAEWDGRERRTGPDDRRQGK